MLTGHCMPWMVQAIHSIQLVPKTSHCPIGKPLPAAHMLAALMLGCYGVSLDRRQVARNVPEGLIHIK